MRVELENFEILGYGNTVLFLDMGTWTQHNILINKCEKYDILTKNNNQTHIKHDFIKFEN